MKCIFGYRIKGITKEGDFSFIKNRIERERMRCDYNDIDKLFTLHDIDGWYLLRNNNFEQSFRNNKTQSISENLRDILFKKVNGTIWDVVNIEDEVVIVGFNTYENKNIKNIWDVPCGENWNILVKLFKRRHTEKTLNSSIRNLSVIANYGWEFFVKTYTLY